MKAILDILEAWSELWRHPELLVAVARARAGEDDAGALVKGLIDGLATPRPPQESLLSLLRAGEFTAARWVLDLDEFRTTVGIGDCEALSKALDEARGRAVEEVHARAAALEARARRAGLDAALPGGLDDAIDGRRSDGDSLLDGWEAKICAAEAKVSGELQRRLGEATRKPGAETTAQAAAWRASVQRCLDAREYEAARFLLDSGPTAALPVEPLLVPRRPRWPWDEPLVEVLQWFAGTRPAPPEFHDKWRHDPGDRPAVRLVEVLSRVASAGVPDVESASVFAACLDDFLGHGGAEKEVNERGAWFETRLRAVCDPRLPCLGASGPEGACLWIPRIGDAAPPARPLGEAMGICFLPVGGVSCPARTIGFDSWTLLPLLADRDQEHRRLNFLRALGSRVELDAAIPPEIGTIPLPPRVPAAARIFAVWVLDIVNVGVADPAVVDLVVYYAGADPRLVLHLLRALFGSASSRRAALGLADLERAWRSPVFRDAARVELLGPLDAQPLLRAVLGAALFTGSHPGGAVPAEDVSFAIKEFWQAEVQEPEVRRSLDRLAELGLVEVVQPAAGYRLPASGIGSILLGAVSDVDGYVRSALDGMARR